MSYELLTIPYKRYYCASWYSLATLVCFCTYFLATLFAFLIVAATARLWITNVVGVEQVNFDFKSTPQYFATILCSQTAGGYMTDTITNMPRQESLSTSLLLARQVTYEQRDVNQDGLIDSIEIDFGMIINAPVIATQAVQEIDLLLFFDYQISSFTKAKSKGMIRLNTNNFSGLPLKSVIFTGQLDMKTTRPIPRSTYTYMEISNVNPLLENQFIIEQAFESYYRREIRVDANYKTHVAGIMNANDPDNLVNVKVILQLDNKSTFLFKPTVIHIVREAWVQFFAVYFPLLYFSDVILRFIYKYKFLYTNFQTNLPSRTKAS